MTMLLEYIYGACYCVSVVVSRHIANHSYQHAPPLFFQLVIINQHPTISMNSTTQNSMVT